MNKMKLFTVNLKKRIVKSVLWSVVLCASETWSMRQKEFRSHGNVDLE